MFTTRSVTQYVLQPVLQYNSTWDLIILNLFNQIIWFHITADVVHFDLKGFNT